MSDTTPNEAAGDAESQIAQLKKQVADLMSERVTPILSDAASKAQAAAQQASDFTKAQAEIVAEQVRDMPLTAVLVSLVTGYLLGRLFR